MQQHFYPFPPRATFNQVLFTHIETLRGIWFAIVQFDISENMIFLGMKPSPKGAQHNF
jgi:hypothetical protein